MKKTISSFYQPTACFILVLSFIFIYPVAIAQKEQAPKVKKEIKQNFNIKNKERALETQVETEFDIFGKIIQFTEYDILPQGRTALNKQTINKYDLNGQLIGSMIYDLNNSLLFREDLTRDEENRIIKSVKIDYTRTPHQSHSTTFEYDTYGNESIVRTFDTKNTLTSERKRFYNHLGDMMRQEYWYYIYDKDKNKIKYYIQTENQFDENGHIFRSTSDIQKGKKKWKEIRQFQNSAIISYEKYENGKLASHYKITERDTSYNNPAYEVIPIPGQPFPMEYDDKERDVLQGIDHTEFLTITMKTDEYGNINKKVVRERGEVLSVTHYTYNARQVLLKESTLNKLTDDVEEVLYEYDEYDNLVKQVKLYNNEPLKELIVIYEYY